MSERGTDKGQVLGWIEEHAKNTVGTDPNEFDEEYVRLIIKRMRVLFGEKHHYFNVDARGWENVPQAPAMVVSNHSGGTIIPDAWGFGFAWHTHFAMKRPLRVMAHELVFSIHALGRVFAKGGVLRAKPELGQKVLAQWKQDLLVMPGGDRDVWRPYKERYKVKFAGRRGYARLALKTRVPIVPVANAGAHETLRVLTDGAPIARFLQFPRLFRANIFPVHLSFPWGLAIGPWPHLPPPTTLRYRIGPVVLPDDGYPEPGVEPTKDQIQAYDDKVQAAVQDLLHQLEDEERAARHAPHRRLSLAAE